MLLYYKQGFFLTVCPQAVLKIAQYASENNKIFIMNLGAPFICHSYKTDLITLLPYINILFGNSDVLISQFNKNYKSINLRLIS